MSPLVDIDDDVFDYLKSQAEPFTDTPSSVLRRLLHLDGASVPVGGAGSHEATLGQKQPAPRATRRAPGKRSNGRTRAPSGTLLPEQQYEMPLLRALADAGGEAPYRDVVEAVGRQLHEMLMPTDFETLSSGGIRWHSRLQFVRLRLIERGEMDRNAPRGVWRITEAGREALRSGSAS